QQGAQPLELLAPPRFGPRAAGREGGAQAGDPLRDAGDVGARDGRRGGRGGGGAHGASGVAGGGSSLAPARGGTPSEARRAAMSGPALPGATSRSMAAIRPSGSM